VAFGKCLSDAHRFYKEIRDANQRPRSAWRLNGTEALAAVA
jgi:hypothetical protein